MLAHDPGGSLAHRLDPRSKLLVQVGFAVAAFAHTAPRGLAALSVLALGALAAARLSPLAAAREYRYAAPFLLGAPLVEAVRVGPPWVVAADAVPPALASYRVALVLLVSAAYVRSTPPSDSRAAVQRTVPGRAGQFLGVGVGLVFRFLPVVQNDLARVRDASAARLGERRSVHERVRFVATAGLNRALNRADRLALALRARCFAWNPTLPALSFARRDVPALLLGAALVVSAVR
ncbi:MAG: energy-coupling factor transporter transmembrane protein EcfT [Haloferacaceae archaeon]